MAVRSSASALPCACLSVCLSVHGVPLGGTPWWNSDSLSQPVPTSWASCPRWHPQPGMMSKGEPKLWWFWVGRTKAQHGWDEDFLWRKWPQGWLCVARGAEGQGQEAAEPNQRSDRRHWCLSPMLGVLWKGPANLGCARIPQGSLTAGGAKSAAWESRWAALALWALTCLVLNIFEYFWRDMSVSTGKSAGDVLWDFWVQINRVGIFHLSVLRVVKFVAGGDLSVVLQILHFQLFPGSAEQALERGFMHPSCGPWITHHSLCVSFASWLSHFDTSKVFFVFKPLATLVFKLSLPLKDLWQHFCKSSISWEITQTPKPHDWPGKIRQALWGKKKITEDGQDLILFFTVGNCTYSSRKNNCTTGAPFQQHLHSVLRQLGCLEGWGTASTLWWPKSLSQTPHLMVPFLLSGNSQFSLSHFWVCNMCLWETARGIYSREGRSLNVISVQKNNEWKKNLRVILGKRKSVA